MAIHILGIRHHGVGSAKKVLERLAELKPDLILVEGPPEITPLLKDIGREELVPPVAIMVYNEKNPAQSNFYPFATFSPEWVAASYGNNHNIPVQALDLPAALSFQLANRKMPEPEAPEDPIPSKDPLSYLSDIAGFDTSESWWEYYFEKDTSHQAKEHFEAIHLGIKALREAGVLSFLDEENQSREAYMRMIIQQAVNEMHDTIAVVCGAWHGPALFDIEEQFASDQKILKSLPKKKLSIHCSWIPWTNSRLSFYSGYGAGLRSPGWYEHLWETQEDREISWLSKIGQAFREAEVDCSTAHVMESYRLARALASLRNKAHISLEELNEAVHTVMCMGDGILFELVKHQVIVGEKMGTLPEDVPKVPLQQDFEQQAKSLRLKFSPVDKQLDLDLRKPLDLKRSIFFHRLRLLDIPWARQTRSRTKGTFKESWVLKWEAAMQIALVDKAFYGNTIYSACHSLLSQKLQSNPQISELVAWLAGCIPAELYDSLDLLLKEIHNASAISADTQDVMRAIPPLVEIIKYGNVRKSDTGQLRAIVQRLFTKVCISLPNACYGLDEENSKILFEEIGQVNTSVQILENAEITIDWYAALKQIPHKSGVHPVILGFTTRLLLDNNQIPEAEAHRLVSYHLSHAQPAGEVAAWVEGFLRGSALILLYDERIWNLLYDWVATVPKEDFLELLPILRRAFSLFQFGERRQIGTKVKQGFSDRDASPSLNESSTFDEQLAASILPHILPFLSGK